MSRVRPVRKRKVFILLGGFDEEFGDLVADRKHLASWLNWHSLEF